MLTQINLCIQQQKQSALSEWIEQYTKQQINFFDLSSSIVNSIFASYYHRHYLYFATGSARLAVSVPIFGTRATNIWYSDYQ